MKARHGGALGDRGRMITSLRSAWATQPDPVSKKKKKERKKKSEERALTSKITLYLRKITMAAMRWRMDCWKMKMGRQREVRRLL
jgi:hypothetical protein